MTLSKSNIWHPKNVSHYIGISQMVLLGLLPVRGSNSTKYSQRYITHFNSP